MNIDKAVLDWYSDPANWQPHEPGAGDFDNSLLDIAKMIEAKHILNIGCFYPNTELNYAHLANSWLAIDFSTEVIIKCKLMKAIEPYVDFLNIDIRTMSPYPRAFETVLDFSSGDHLIYDDYVIMLKNVSNIIRHGGYFVTTYANLDYFDSPEAFGQWGYERRIHSADLIELIKMYGFTIERNENKSSRSGVVARKI